MCVCGGVCTCLCLGCNGGDGLCEVRLSVLLCAGVVVVCGVDGGVCVLYVAVGCALFAGVVWFFWLFLKNVCCDCGVRFG